MGNPMIEISYKEYWETDRLYSKLCSQLPLKLFEIMPSFYDFLSPAHYSSCPDPHRQYIQIELSITGQRRYNMLHSPHALTLLKVYAIQCWEKQ
jgi:hypothetical protein